MIDTPIELRYELEEHGWAVLRAAFGDRRFDFRVSYMSDALPVLVEATVALASGATERRVGLIDEPGHHCLALFRQGDRLRIVVAHLSDLFTTDNFNSDRQPEQRPPEEEGEILAVVDCQLPDLVTAVKRMVAEINSRYAPADFVRTRNSSVPPELAVRLATCGTRALTDPPP
ncbi:MAG TPA: hypothetical protein VF796_24880 [Humisphaera sp.]